MANFEAAFDKTVRRWERFVLTDAPGDYGRQTYAGITRRHWPDWAGWGLLDAGKTVPDLQVRSFYNEQFWHPIEGNALRHQDVAEIIFDWAVNAGVPKAVFMALDVLGLPSTLGMLAVMRELNNLASPRLFVCEYALRRIAYRVERVGRDETQAKWLRGWVNRDLFFALGNG